MNNSDSRLRINKLANLCCSDTVSNEIVGTKNLAELFSTIHICMNYYQIIRVTEGSAMDVRSNASQENFHNALKSRIVQ